jgi:hypothetical protein
MGTPVEELQKEPLAQSDAANTYISLDLGVWRVLLPKDALSPGFRSSKEKWNTIAAASPLLLRFVREIYALNPYLVTLVVLLKLWGGVESVLMLYVSSRLLQIVRVSLILCHIGLT